MAHASRMRLVSSDIRAPDDILPRLPILPRTRSITRGRWGGVTRCTPQRQVGSIRAATDEGGLSTRCARACASHCAVVRPWPDAVVNLPTWYQVGPPWPTNPAARATHIFYSPPHLSIWLRMVPWASKTRTAPLLARRSLACPFDARLVHPYGQQSVVLRVLEHFQARGAAPPEPHAPPSAACQLSRRPPCLC